MVEQSVGYNSFKISNVDIDPYSDAIFLYKPWRPKGFLQLEIIMS